MEVTDETIGNNINRIRLSKGISREQLSRKVGVSAQQLYKYEHAINSVTAWRLGLIAEAMKVKVCDFFI